MRTMIALAATLVLAPQVPTQTQTSTTGATGSKIWVGRNAEFEELLKTSPIARIADIPVGVTKPRRVFFAPGGPISSAVCKNLKPGRQSGYWESYKSEIAAYEVDKLLGLEMVPVTVERRIEGNLVSVQLWVEDCKWLKQRKEAGQSPPDAGRWNRQVHRQRVFDNLIGNIDRNEGNLLVDPDWNLILIDHSRAFTDTMTMPFAAQMKRIDRPVFERLKALDLPTLKERIGSLVLGEGWLKALLKRRDRIVRHFEDLAVSEGEDEVFIP